MAKQTNTPAPSAGDRSFGERARSAAHRPALSVSGPYGRPIHPLLVTVPIGAWVAAVAFDVASLAVEGRAFGRAAQWLVAIGVVAAAVAAVFGFLDFRRLTKGTRAHKTAVTHMVLMDVALVLFIVSFVLRRADADQFLDGTPVLAFILAVVALVVLIGGAWLGGRLAYGFGVRVVDEEDQLVGHLPEAPPNSRADRDRS
jgi:uncharacterized membrane protein